MKRLNAAETALDGKALIEASAGTGKTWTITALYLRLIIEQGFAVQEILVVTFTNAATRELRDRLRKRLALAHDRFSDVALSEKDSLLETLYQHSNDREDAARRLLIALRNFDECAVFTIHGFCGLLLREAALESGLPLEQEMLMDDSDLKQRIADDFWRRRLLKQDAALEALFRRDQLSPETLLADVQHAVPKPYLDICRDDLDMDYDVLLQQRIDAYRSARSEWDVSADEISDIILNHSCLNRKSYNKNNASTWLNWMAAYLDADEPGELETSKGSDFGYATKVERFMTRGIKVKEGCEPPGHRFFELWDDFVQSTADIQHYLDSYHNYLRESLLRELRQELSAEKKRTGAMTPDDVLLGLHAALEGEQGNALARQALERFPVALIDEFQDTDPVQYAIFDKLYGGQNGRVFYVGDPKQAIYGFRGADVFTYLQARVELAEKGGELLTLDTNWRSTRDVVEGVNGLFDGHEKPFWLENMAYQPVEDSGMTSDLPLLADGGAFRLLTLDVEKEPRPDTNDKVAQAVADEIASLLLCADAEGWRVDERPFTGSDVAVLVRTHNEGDLVKQALAKRGISCVQASRNSVFGSTQAEQLAILMTAIAHGNSEAHIRLALATDMLGLSASDIIALGDDAAAWDDWLERFGHWRQIWLSRGFAVMMREILMQAEVYSRVRAQDDGERQMTDLLHLVELLHHEVSMQSLGMESLLRWLHRARERAGKEKNTPDERRLRLESDENLVAIVTIHASKGLEYNVVYCPWLWVGKPPRSDHRPFEFHNREQDNQPSLELGSARRDDWLQMKQEESFADDLRLLYVAVTRAKLQCVVVACNARDADKSALAWLLHGRGLAAMSLEAAQQEIRDRLDQGSSPAELSPAITCEPLDCGHGSVHYEGVQSTAIRRPRKFVRKLSEPRRITSYTGLVAGRHMELPEHDLLVWRQNDKDDVLRGPQAGSCLHALLEHLDFAVPVAQQSDLVSATLAQFGFDVSLLQRVALWMQRVLQAPLFENNEFCLAHLGAAQRINEMEFYFPVNNLDIRHLAGILQELHPVREFSRAATLLDGYRVSGFLKGYIDLIYRRDGRYYLADYKSNWLGELPGNYDRETMRQNIAAEHYYLQYLIYTLALHRYLGQRLADYDYERHFGGVQYLYLRGMGAGSPASGVYFERPSLGLVQALEEWLE